MGLIACLSEQWQVETMWKSGGKNTQWHKDAQSRPRQQFSQQKRRNGFEFSPPIPWEHILASPDFPAQLLMAECLHQELDGISSIALLWYQSLWATFSLPLMWFGCAEMHSHCWVAMVRLLLLEVAVEMPLKKGEVTVAGEKVLMLSFLRTEKRRRFCHSFAEESRSLDLI